LAERGAQAGASDRFGDACKSGSAQAAAAASKLSAESDRVNAPPRGHGEPVPDDPATIFVVA
jgi:hypothetical protein